MYIDLDGYSTFNFGASINYVKILRIYAPSPFVDKFNT